MPAEQHGVAAEQQLGLRELRDRRRDLPAALSTARLAAADDLIGDRSPVAMSTLIPPLVLTGDLGGAMAHVPTLWDIREQSRSLLAWGAPTVAAIALACGLRGDDDGFRLWRDRAERVAGGLRSRYLASFAAFVDARTALKTTPAPVAAAQAEAVPVNADLVDAAFAEFPPQDWYRGYAAASDAAAENDWAAACLSRATARLTGDADELAAAAQGWERIGARYERACTPS